MAIYNGNRMTNEEAILLENAEVIEKEKRKMPKPKKRRLFKMSKKNKKFDLDDDNRLDASEKKLKSESKAKKKTLKAEGKGKIKTLKGTKKTHKKGYKKRYTEYKKNWLDYEDPMYSKDHDKMISQADLQGTPEFRRYLKQLTSKGKSTKDAYSKFLESQGYKHIYESGEEYSDPYKGLSAMATDYSQERDEFSKEMYNLKEQYKFDKNPERYQKKVEDLYYNLRDKSDRSKRRADKYDYGSRADEDRRNQGRWTDEFNEDYAGGKVGEAIDDMTGLKLPNLPRKLAEAVRNIVRPNFEADVRRGRGMKQSERYEQWNDDEYDFDQKERGKYGKDRWRGTDNDREFARRGRTERQAEEEFRASNNKWDYSQRASDLLRKRHFEETGWNAEFGPMQYDDGDGYRIRNMEAAEAAFEEAALEGKFGKGKGVKGKIREALNNVYDKFLPEIHERKNYEKAVDKNKHLERNKWKYNSRMSDADSYDAERVSLAREHGIELDKSEGVYNSKPYTTRTIKDRYWEDRNEDMSKEWNEAQGKGEWRDEVKPLRKKLKKDRYH